VRYVKVIMNAELQGEEAQFNCYNLLGKVTPVAGRGGP
jgi:hypothetical protein